MIDIIKIGNRYFPLSTIVSIDDEGEQVIVAVRDRTAGPGEFRVQGEDAEALRAWLAERVAVSVDTEHRTKDTGYRSDD